MTWLLVTQYPLAQLALWASFPGSHIAQFRCQVIGNCGVIRLSQRSEEANSPVDRVPLGSPTIGFDSVIAVGGARNMTVSWHLGHPKVGVTAARE